MSKATATKEKPARKRPTFPDLTQTIEAVLELLDHPESSRRCAAAIVLGEIGASHDEVMRRLRICSCRKDDPALRRRVAEAIGAIAPKTIVTDLQPLLTDEDESVRESARQVLATGDTVKVQDVAKMLDSSDDAELLAAVAVLGAIGGAAARRKLLAKLEHAKVKVREAIVEALEPSLRRASGRQAKQAIEDLEGVIDPERLASDRFLANAVVQLLGWVHDEGAVEGLLRVAELDCDSKARGAAIEALRRVLPSRKPKEKVVRFLLECLENSETPAELLSPAVDVISGFDVPIALEPRVRGLLQSESNSIRRYAIQALRRLDTAPAARALAKVVEEGDPADRAAALESALETPTGRNELAKMAVASKDPERVRLVAHGLRQVEGKLSPQTLHTLEDGVLDADEAVAQILVELLRHVGGESASRVQGTLHDRAIELKSAGRYGEAAELFRRICQGPKADPEARFQLAVCELKTSKKVISRGPKNDPCLAAFRTLLSAKDFPLIDRLRVEEIVDPEELYYLGFSFAEGDEGEQGLGGDVLMLVAEVAEGSKLGKMANNKLVTMGWQE